jgi:hypothetical protein
VKTRIFVCCVMVLLGRGLWAQGQTGEAPSVAELAAITARGHALAEYDAAAWHSSDAVEALKPAKGAVERYVARKTNDGWVVMYGRFTEAKTKFLIVYEVRQTANPTEYKVITHDPPVEDADVYFRAAKALELVSDEFNRESKATRPYNVSVLAGPAGDWYLYAIPAQTDLRILPYGGDVRYTVSADGTKILEKRQMHKAVIEEKVSEDMAFDYHAHILSDIPEDSDTFYALTRKAKDGEIIATKKFVYGVSPDAQLSFLGKADEVLKQLEAGKAEGIPKQYQSALVQPVRQLLSGGAAPKP